MSVPAASAFAVLGLVIGSAVSTLYLLALKLADKRKNKVLLLDDSRFERGEHTLTNVLRIAFPITLGASLLGATRVIDMTLIMRRLQDIGISTAAANEIYGSYTTLALPVFSLVPALATPISETITGEGIDIKKPTIVGEKAMAIIAKPAGMTV